MIEHRQVNEFCNRQTEYLLTNSDRLGQDIAQLQWRAKERESQSRPVGKFPKLEKKY